MMERYSHIRSQAKQAAIETLNEHAITPVLGERRYNFRYKPQNEEPVEDSSSLKTNSGPARIRTWDQRIMSTLVFNKKQSFFLVE